MKDGDIIKLTVALIESIGICTKKISDSINNKVARTAKVRITGNYVSRFSNTNRIDEIINIQIDFTMDDIIKQLKCSKDADGYAFDKIDVLCIF